MIEKERITRNFKEKYKKGDLEELRKAGIEPSFNHVIGCKKCPFLNKCISVNSEFIEDVEKIEEEYGVILGGRCPLLLIDPL